jgi:hypothetical protein
MTRRSKVFAVRPKDAGLFIFDSFKKFDGKTYVALNNFPVGKQNALALLHDDLATFEVIGHYNEPQTQQLSESAVNRLPDGTWMAICAQRQGQLSLHHQRRWQKMDRRHGDALREGLELEAHLSTSLAMSITSAGRTLTRDQRRPPHHLQHRHLTRWQNLGAQIPLRDAAIHSNIPRCTSTKGTIWLSVTQGTQKDRIMFGKLESVGEFESQKGQKRIEWPAPPPPAPAVMKRGVKLFTDRDYVIDEMPERCATCRFIAPASKRPT